MKRLAKFFRRGWRDRLLFAEALGTLLWAKLVVHAVPFRRLAPRLGRAQAETLPAVPPPVRAIAVDVSWAVQAVARHIALGFVCLPQAVAAKWMLRRRGLASTLYLGVATNPEDRASLIAHAWLRVGDKIVTGETEAANHRKLASFAD